MMTTRKSNPPQTNQWSGSGGATVTLVKSRTLSDEEQLLIESHFGQFGALMPLKVFVRDVRNGVTPSRDLLEDMADKINRYLESEGSISLDRCFGVVSRRGNDGIFAKSKKSRRDNTLCSIMMQLRQNFKLSIVEAARMVSELPNSLDEDTLEARFKKNRIWKMWREDEHEEWFILREDQKKNYLKKFPYHSLPQKIMSLHPDHQIRP
ncbi:MAG: hypothetical protein R3B74_11980 [Nitrospirales bacterium]|nr:hypothetical protein [Nitrospirales bacterium]